MKTTPLIFVCALVCALFSGCIVQSFYPFYTEKAKIKVPELQGEWELVKTSGDDAAEKKISPWIFTQEKTGECALLAYDEKNRPGNLTVVVFKVGDVTFCDFTADNPSDESRINEYWLWNVQRVHTLCKMELTGDQLELRPLDYEWMENAVKQKTVSVPHVKQRVDSQDAYLFTATSEQWREFLTKFAKDPKAFPDNHIFVLKKLRQNPEDAAKPKEPAQ